MTALSLSLRDKERFRDWEIERAWQFLCPNKWRWVGGLSNYDDVIKYTVFLKASLNIIYFILTTFNNSNVLGEVTCKKPATEVAFEMLDKKVT